MPRFAVLSICLALSVLLPSVQAADDDPLIIGPRPTPRDELRRLSSGELPVPAEQLLTPYLETQWNRLIGKDEGSAKLKIKTPPLNEKEQNELSRWFEIHPRLRERLLLALDPEVDDLRAGARVAITLLRKL